MPQLDVSEVLSDPDIAGTRFQVVRRQETVNSYGERTNSVLRLAAFGSVTPTGDNSMAREDAYQNSQKSIHVVTSFILRGPSLSQINQTFDPDLVFWRGDYYVVKSISDYSQFGAGMVEADCISTDYTEQAAHNP